MIRARVRNNSVPNHGLVGRIVHPRRPLSGYVHEQLLRVPRKERREVRLEGEFEDGVLLLLGAVVVRPALDNLDVCGGNEGGGWRAGGEQVGHRDEGAEDERDCCEEAEDVLDASKGAVHGRHGGAAGLQLAGDSMLLSCR